MVLLQSKLYFSKDPEGGPEFSRRRGSYFFLMYYVGKVLFVVSCGSNGFKEDS